MPTRKRTTREDDCRPDIVVRGRARLPIRRRMPRRPARRARSPSRARAAGTGACRSGPGGASGLVSGLVARHASNATRNCGRKRRSAIAIACSLPAVYAANHALKVEESKFRSSIASRWARFAFDLAVEDSARSTRDSVLHFAAAYPDQAANKATIERSTASAIESSRSRCSCASVLGVLGDFLADLGRRQSLGHDGALGPNGRLCPGAVPRAGLAPGRMRRPDPSGRGCRAARAARCSPGAPGRR